MSLLFTARVVYGLGSGFGWALAIVALASIRERMRYSNVPARIIIKIFLLFLHRDTSLFVLNSSFYPPPYHTI